MKWTAMLLSVAATVAPAVAQERLVVLSPDGTILATVDGDESSVTIAPSIQALFMQADGHLRLTHNHPRSASLSGDDLSQLARPGVDVIEAVGADGSRYSAMRGPRFHGADFIRWQYRAVDRAVRQLLRRPSDEADVFDRWGFGAHLAALALCGAGVIDYRVSLSPAQSYVYRRHTIEFARITELVAGRIKRQEAVRFGVER